MIVQYVYCICGEVSQGQMVFPSIVVVVDYSPLWEVPVYTVNQFWIGLKYEEQSDSWLSCVCIAVVACGIQYGTIINAQCINAF